MAKQITVLCVHGVNVDERESGWQPGWTQAIETGFKQAGSQVQIELTFLPYNDIFDRHPMAWAGTAEAVAKLVGSGIVHGIGDLFRVRGMRDTIRWTAGMVVQWAENESLRKQTRARLAAAVRKQQPDLILAHSLGSLVAYVSGQFRTSGMRLPG
jgi:hypothetical protein